MRYDLPTDRLINLLIPHYLGGRRYILFLQSLVYPLRVLNQRFAIYAREKLIEANMTSQVIYFEWYLNYKFGKYLKDPLDRIYIQDSETLGVDLYRQDSEVGRPFTIWYQSEPVTGSEAEQPRQFYFTGEEKAINKVSFKVCVSAITIPEHEFVYMLSYVVNTYKIAGKTYLIKIDHNEINPLNNA